MTIQEAVTQTGVSAYTLRFYEKNGLIPHIQRKSNGIRQFSEADIAFIRFLTQLKRTGMSLEDIADFTRDGCILEQLRSGNAPNSPWKGVLLSLSNNNNGSMSSVSISILYSKA